MSHDDEIADRAPTRAPRIGGRDLRGWRQVRCRTCGLPEARCFCAAMPALAVRTRVVVVMHPIEAVRSTNTGRLAAHMLTGASVRRRGDDDAPCDALIGRRLLLFPIEGARPLRPDDAGDDLTLVVPDGTWAQARRIARRDPLGRGAEAVTVSIAGESAYGLRRGAREGGLCTIEAVAAAMGVLEGGALEAAMLAAFAAWRERAMAVRSGRR